ncbi:MAG: S9 family peptidase, partial [Gemmatimonadales bacterium]
TVLAWRDALEGDRQLLDGAVEGELGIQTMRGITWADDGSRIFVGVQPREPVEDEEEEEKDERNANGADSVPGLEIWHSRDIDPVPQQRVRANMERNRSHILSWELGMDPVLLGGGEAGESISLLPDHTGAILQDDTPYGLARMFGPIYRDVYHVDGSDGERRLLAEEIEFFSGVSPDATWAIFFRDDHWHTIELATGEIRNITEGLPTTFTNEKRDIVVPQKPPHGLGGWVEGDQDVLLYDEYDVWQVAADGSGGERLTAGAEDEIRHRLVRLDWDEPAFPADGPHLVSLYGEWTKRSGYGRIEAPGQVERLVWDDRMISRLSRADDETTHFYMTQRYDEPPAFHVVDGDWGDARRVVQSNAFIDEFRIGRSELIDYENDWGVPLQAALYYPADYEEGREYPMIVYHYERLSQGLHGWTNPSDRSAYNTRVFTQNGYFVLQPDIVYRPRNPGLSAMEAILPAVDAAVATGMIDESAIGIIGHSWGGYQTTFAVTQTDRFAAAVAGAPLTNLVSMYLSFYWNTGSTDARIFEISQGRMEVPWWEDFESYRLNSPVHHIEAMDTPLLMMFGDEDGAVEFNQGVEFYNAARRAAKDFVLLVYEGENHSLSERPNQEDYHRRSLEWFDHYLKGAEAPAWITEGVPYLEQQEKLQRGPAAGRR